MTQLDTVSGQMQEMSRGVLHTDPGTTETGTAEETDTLLAPHRISILQWQWALKVGAL